MGRVIGILAHVDAGKTTLAEQILYHTNVIRTRGRVDHKNAFLDNHEIEKERGITVFSDQASFDYQGHSYFLLDTPGHIDFSAEMERAVQVMDYAVIVISGLDGVQGHTQTVWKLLKHRNVPVFFFINKTDRDEVDVEHILGELKQKLSPDIVMMGGHLVNDEMDDNLAEEIASRDDSLLEYYLEYGYSKERWEEKTSCFVRERKLFPCFCGSALMDVGVEELLHGLDLITVDKNDTASDSFSGQVYKIRHDSQKKRWTYLKVISGSLKVKDEIEFFSRETGEMKHAKINEIQYYNGKKGTAVSQVSAGELCAVSGLNDVRCGDFVGSRVGTAEYEMVPMLRVSVEYDKAQYHAKTVLEYLHILEIEDPMLSVSWDEALQEIQLHIMGTIQLEILKEILMERFSLAVSFGTCRILYRETIASAVVGYGHFEPLKHYAEVHLKIEPAERGTGILFESGCSVDQLSQNFQNLVRTHIFEKEHKGTALGMPLTDVKITLLTGRAHEKHTEGGDFREATYRALRQGLLQTESVILEPFYAFVVEAEDCYTGRLLSDIQKMSGTFELPQTMGQTVQICGRAPVSTMLNYYQEFIAFTKGKGSLSLMFDGYDLCHNPQEVIEEFSYDPERDVFNTGDSVFCSHGSGFMVKWQDAKRYMHCKS
jgi:ribosomal protection tetracycline resistance protein